MLFGCVGSTDKPKTDNIKMQSGREIIELQQILVCDPENNTITFELVEPLCVLQINEQTGMVYVYKRDYGKLIYLNNQKMVIKVSDGVNEVFKSIPIIINERSKI